MESVNWEEILGDLDGKCIIAGDFNSHSKRWDNGANVREGGGSARWLERLINDYNLSIHSSGEATYYKDNSACSSAIDLQVVLAQRGVRVVGWRVEDDDEAATTSDHEVISWGVDMDAEERGDVETETWMENRGIHEGSGEDEKGRGLLGKSD